VKRTNFNIVWGILLVGAGILFMLQELGVIGKSWETGWEILWTIVFGAVGVAFVWWYLSDLTGSWWAIIPGCTLLSLAALVGLAALGFGDTAAPWLGALFLGGIGLSFWIVYLTRREYWWAVIPGGVLFSLALVALVATWYQGEVLGAIFFLGMAATFGLVCLLPTPHGRMIWALIPAGVFTLLGLAVMLAFTTVFNYMWAVVMILVGVYLLFRQRGGGELTRRG
jgi:hypothetical protein